MIYFSHLFSSGNLYFTNAFESETYLEVLAINTTYRMILLKSFQDQPRDLAVSPKLRYLFWTDGGQTPKIERALLDGTNRTVLASESLASPRGLTVDYTNDFLYWTDDVLDMISRMAVDGTQRQIIRYGSRYPSPVGMAIFGNYMLWVDKKLGKLFQASKDPASNDQAEVTIYFNLTDRFKIHLCDFLLKLPNNVCVSHNSFKNVKYSSIFRKCVSKITFTETLVVVV